MTLTRGRPGLGGSYTMDYHVEMLSQERVLGVMAVIVHHQGKHGAQSCLW